MSFNLLSTFSLTLSLQVGERMYRILQKLGLAGYDVMIQPKADDRSIISVVIWQHFTGQLQRQTPVKFDFFLKIPSF